MLNLFFLSLAIPHRAQMTSLFEPFAGAIMVFWNPKLRVKWSKWHGGGLGPFWFHDSEKKR